MTELDDGVDTSRLARRLASSDQLARRQLVQLPLAGPGAAFADIQPRSPSSSSQAPEELAELISSIATVGVLQPILVEDLADGRRRLVSGERRLRAAKWLAVHQPDQPHSAHIPAVVCPGPLSEEDRRVWQLVENLARDELAPGELAAALLYERCAVLTGKLLAAGVAVPADVADLDDPVARFRKLDELRRRHGHTQMGAPWPEVLGRLGIQIPERRARQLTRAFAELPADVSAEMDEAKVALHTRLRYLELDRGNRQAASELWDAVKQRERPELLTAAVRARLADDDLDGDAAVDAAAAYHADADAARAAQPASAAGDADHHDALADGPDAAGDVGGPAGDHPLAHEPTPVGGDGGGDEVAAAALAALRQLLARLAAGAAVSTYDAGSLRLCARQLLEALTDADHEAA